MGITFFVFKILESNSIDYRISAIEQGNNPVDPVGYTVASTYLDIGKPGFIFVEVQMTLAEANNLTTIAFSYKPGTIYIIDSFGIHHDPTKSDQIIFKLQLPENTNASDINIIGSTIITS